MRISYVYLITNNLNGKTYVGKRKAPENIAPEQDNYWGSGKIITNSIAKNGLENFTKTILYAGEFTNDELNEIERYYIHLGRLNGKCEYNISNGGDGGITYKGENPRKGCKMPREIVEKIRTSNIGRKMPETTREAIRKANLGSKRDPEQRANISAGIRMSEAKKRDTEYRNTPEGREKRSKILKEYWKHHTQKTKGMTNRYTPEQLKRMSEGRKAAVRPYTMEEYARMSESQRGRVTSEETKEKLRKNRPNYNRTVEFNHTGWTVICVETGEELSIAEAYEKYGTGHIADVCRGARKTACGHTWKWGHAPKKDRN